MDLQITRVTLSKEISWDSVKECRELYVEMMRNRVTIDAMASFQEREVEDGEEVLFEKFKEDTRKLLNGNNVGLYSFSTVERLFHNNEPVWFDRDSFDPVMVNHIKGHITIFFEDAGDYARFVKDRAVMFKLSVV